MACQNGIFVLIQAFGVLVEAGRRLGNSADAQPEQHVGALVGIAHEVAVQPLFGKGSSQGILRQGEMVKPHFHIAGCQEDIAGNFV